MTLQGKRYYLRSDLTRIVKFRFPALAFCSPVTQFIDFAVNLVHDQRKAGLANNELEGWIPLQEQDVNDDTWLFVGLHRKEALFRSRPEEFQWVLNHTWVSHSPEYAEEQKKYPFSLYIPDFRRYSAVYRISRNEIKAMVIL